MNNDGLGDIALFESPDGSSLEFQSRATDRGFLGGLLDLLGQLLIAIRVDGDGLGKPEGHASQMQSARRVRDGPQSQDTHGLLATFLVAVAEETVVNAVRPALRVSLDVEGDVADAGRQHDLATVPAVALVVARLEQLVGLDLADRLDRAVLELDGGVAGGQVGATRGAQLGRVAVVPSEDVVHVLGLCIAVDARVEDDCRVQLTGQAGGCRETSGTGADDEHVDEQGSVGE